MSAEFNTLMASDNTHGLEVAELSEFIKDQLYFMVLSNYKDSTTIQSFNDWKKTLNDNNIFYLNVDDFLVYDGFYSDFGPLNLAMIYRYIGIMRDKFKVYKKLVHCSHLSDQKKRANAAFLICAYMIVEDNWTAHQAYTAVSQQYKHQYKPFRDASCLLQSEYSVTVEECVNALFKAKWYGFFDFDDFDVKEYERYETVNYGDINWIIPGTMLAFSSPHSRDFTDKSGYQIHSPAYYYEYFKKNNVQHVVRLNCKKTYDAKRTFVAVANIQHTDMVFTDGTPPPNAILKSFLRLCEQYNDEGFKGERTNDEIIEPNLIITNKSTNSDAIINKCAGAVAVHCKAGLGRTGCLVASYIMQHWTFTAVEAIAWTRICRPGSVIGVQQQWLIDKQGYIKSLGEQWRGKRNLPINKYKRFTYGVYSIKRHTSNAITYEYVDPPSQSLTIDIEDQSSCSSSGDNEIGCVQEHNQNRLSNVLKKKIKTNNHSFQSDISFPNLKQKRPALKPEEDKLKGTFLTIKNTRTATNVSNETNVNNIVKKKNTPPTTIARSNSKVSIASKKNTKSISLSNQINNRSTRTLTQTETASKITDESHPSYTLATVASTARLSPRLRNQNNITI